MPLNPMNFLMIILIGWIIFFSSVGVAAPESLSAEPDVSVEQNKERLDNVNTLVEKLEKLAENARKHFSTLTKIKKGEARSLAGMQVLEIESVLRKSLDDLIDNIDSMKSDGYDTEKFMTVAKALTIEQSMSLIAELRFVNKVMANLRPSRDEVAPENLFELEQKLNKFRKAVDRLLQALLENTERKKRISLDPSEDLNYLKTRALRRAEILSARVRLSIRQIKELQQRLDKAGDNQKLELEIELNAYEEKKKGTTSSLKYTVLLMKQFKLETTKYSQLLVRATGTISEQTLDTKVVVGLFEQWMEDTKRWLIDNAAGFIVKLFTIMFILLAFKLISIVFGGLVRKAVLTFKASVSLLLQEFFVSVTRKLVMLTGVLICFSQIGFEIGPLIAGLGVIGFIVGFALQDTLSNFASGMMILVYRPFDVGDVIEAAGMHGKVKEMSLVSTTVLTFNNEKMIIPNNKIWGGIIQNVTSEDKRRIDFVFSVGHDADIEQTERVLHSIVEKHELILPEPKPIIHLHQIDEASVKFIVRPWVKTADYWSVYWDVMRMVKLSFEQEKIAKPFPQYNINMRQSDTLSN